MGKGTLKPMWTSRKRASVWLLNLRHFHTKKFPDQGTTKGKVNEEASLPLLQRCKNLLASNWRCQLSTLKPEDDSVHGSLAQYALVGGQALVWLPRDSPHITNLLMDSRGSLVVGHTDPRPLIHTFRAVNQVPPRVVVMGLLDPIPQSQTEYVKKRVLKLVSSTKQAVENAGPQMQGILKESGSSVDARITALDSMVHSSNDEFSIYSLNPRECQYVDLVGGKHEVEVTELAAATVDPLCSVLPGLIEGINQSEARRLALIMFCAVYMHVRVQDAYMFAADRWGINLLGRVDGIEAGDASEGPPSLQQTDNRSWREFRFAFAQEVQSTEQFCVLLAEMEKECLEFLNKAQESQSGLKDGLT